MLAAAMFAYAPFLILGAPYEATMGLVQKIFYFHAACGMGLFLAALRSLGLCCKPILSEEASACQRIFVINPPGRSGTIARSIGVPTAHGSIQVDRTHA